jgi:mRNA interferase RelE/StbE
MEIRYSDKAVKQIKRIHKGDREAAQRILTGIEKYAYNPLGKHDLKTLRGRYGEFKRLRVGEYRIIFDDAGSVMLVYEVKHRQEAYDG